MTENIACWMAWTVGDSPHVTVFLFCCFSSVIGMGFEYDHVVRVTNGIVELREKRSQHPDDTQINELSRHGRSSRHTHTHTQWRNATRKREKWRENKNVLRRMELKAITSHMHLAHKPERMDYMAINRKMDDHNRKRKDVIYFYYRRASLDKFACGLLWCHSVRKYTERKTERDGEGQRERASGRACVEALQSTPTCSCSSCAHCEQKWYIVQNIIADATAPNGK